MSLRSALRSAAIPCTLVLAAVALTGCASAVSLEPAADAKDTACADVVVRLPTTVADQAARETGAQGTGAWGDPASVLLRCGVPSPGPTTDECVSVNGVDWIQDDSDAPTYRFTTFGRSPAVEVILDYDTVSGATTLADLASAVSVIEPTAQCTDVTDVPEPTSTPSSAG
ncbi:MULTISPECIES: DUF3515 family protein [unclassified Leifsonia]|uniref:DUF3515 family protein n=1 Tax=unclassified Leifsonia TaxID=2663824 RepID=UPI0006FC7EB7|nr:MULTISPECIES: DUF3515 family protein [unclassified Leifsonia]KQX07255.1 hypothetical protein ASC59_05545 [Leifsonia sp. Root1293]KRA11538.1 hypothetical protein ASD61_05545 [Leifsonia sp. Root60]